MKQLFVKTHLLTFAFLLSWFSLFAQNFRVSGSKIYDPQGKEFVMKGVNVSGPGFVWPEYTVNEFDQIVNQWGFNAIRVATKGAPAIDSYTYQCVIPDENFPSSYNYKTFGTLREIVDTYTAAKVVVIFEWHQVSSMYTGSELACAKNWWKQVAQAFKDNPYVWFDLYNEPKTDQATWVNSFQQVINEIRSTGSKNVIVVSGNHWGQDANVWNCSNVPEANSAILNAGDQLNDPENKLVFSIHVYDQWTACQSKIDNYLDRVIADGKAIIIGEYGVHNAGYDVTDAAIYALKSAQNRKIGRVAWAWWGGDPNDLTTSGNGGGQHTTFDSQGNPTNLSYFGLLVWNDLRNKRGLVMNGDFALGTVGWKVSSYQGASASLQAVSGVGLSAKAAKVAISSGGNADWHIQLEQSLVLEAGKTYRLSFRARAVGNRPLRVALQGNSDPYPVYWEKNVTLGSNAQSYGPYEFTYQGANKVIGLRFFGGGNSADFFLDDITLAEGTVQDNLLENPGFENGLVNWQEKGAVNNISSVTSPTKEDSKAVLANITDQHQGVRQNITEDLKSQGKGSYYVQAWVNKKYSGSSEYKVTVKLRYGGQNYYRAVKASSSQGQWAKIAGTLNLSWTGTLEEAEFYVESTAKANFYADGTVLRKDDGNGRTATLATAKSVADEPVLSEEASLRVWPNPSTGTIQVQAWGLEDQWVVVHDLMGRKVAESKLEQGQAIVDLTGQAGMYLLRVGAKMHKIIIK